MSLPCQWLVTAGQIVAGSGCDWGSGRSKDADLLGWDKYDPHWGQTDPPAGPYTQMLCAFVLDVLPVDQHPSVLDAIRARLAPGGSAFIVVRRGPSHTRKPYVPITLALPLVHETSAYAIYRLCSSEV